MQIINDGQLVVSDTIAGLTSRMHSAGLTIALRHPPPVAELESLQGIDAVETLGEGRFRLHHAPETEPAETVAAAVVAANWGLYELTPERLSLEDIFVTSPPVKQTTTRRIADDPYHCCPRAAQLVPLTTAWAILAVIEFILAYHFLGRLDLYVQVQPQLALYESAPGLTEVIVSRLFDNASIVLMLVCRW